MAIQGINVGIDMGRPYLTKEVAYFLGLLMCDEKVQIAGETYWVALVRHNRPSVSVEQLTAHYEYVMQIATIIDKQEYLHMDDFYRDQGIGLNIFLRRMRGFGVIFKQTNPIYNMDNLVADIRAQLLSSSEDVVRAFLVGVFDGRSSPDINSNTGRIRYIPTDWSNYNAGQLVEDALRLIGINGINNNSPRERENTGNLPRRPQLRIRATDATIFLERVGFLSDSRFEKVKGALDPNYETIYRNDILTGLKVVQMRGADPVGN